MLTVSSMNTITLACSPDSSISNVCANSASTSMFPDKVTAEIPWDDVRSSGSWIDTIVMGLVIGVTFFSSLFSKNENVAKGDLSNLCA